jgi:hypothetical protein
VAYSRASHEQIFFQIIPGLPGNLRVPGANPFFNPFHKKGNDWWRQPENFPYFTNPEYFSGV